MTTIDRFTVRWRLPQGQPVPVDALDELVGWALGEAFEVSGIPDGEEIAIAHVDVAPQGIGSGEAGAWAEAVASAVVRRIAEGGPDVVRYPNRVAAVSDLVLSLVNGDTTRLWAWRRLGLPQDVCGGLLEIAGQAPALVAAIARSGRLGALVELLGTTGMCRVADAAWRALGADLIPAGPGAAGRAWDVDEIAAWGSDAESAARSGVDDENPAGPGAVSRSAGARVGAEGSDAEGSGAGGIGAGGVGAEGIGAGGIDAGGIGAGGGGAEGIASGGIGTDRNGADGIATGEVSVGRVVPDEVVADYIATGQAAASQAAASQATANHATAYQAAAGEITSGQAASGQAAAGQVAAGQATAGQATAGEAATDQIPLPSAPSPAEDAAPAALTASSLADFARAATDPAIASALAALAAAEAEPAAVALGRGPELVVAVLAPHPGRHSYPRKPRRHGITANAGVLFFLHLLDDDHPLDSRCAHYDLARELVGRSAPDHDPDDPALLAFCGLPPGSAPPRGDPGAPVAHMMIAKARARLAGRELASFDDTALVRAIVRRRGVVTADPGWIEVALDPDDVSVDLRAAGLDLDPGWLPALGCVVRFSYV